jgi:hypothetical protein
MSAPDLQTLARAARGEAELPARPARAESVEFELHYPEEPAMGIFAVDLVVLDREHRRAAEQIAASHESRAPKKRLPPRREGLIVKAPRAGSLDVDSVPQDAIDAALKNPEAYVNAISRLIRWSKAKFRRRRPSGEVEHEEEIEIPNPPAKEDRRGILSERSVWRGHWTYPDGTQIESEFTHEKYE